MQESGCIYTPEPTQAGYDEQTRQQAVRLYVEGMNLRRIGRMLGVNHQSVANWVNAYNAVKLFVYAWNRRQLHKRLFPAYPASRSSFAI